MDSYDYWRLCDQLSVVQAALLMCGEDPSSDMNNVENWNVEQQPMGYNAAKNALIGWIKNEQVSGSIVHEFDPEINGGYEETDRIDLVKSLVNVGTLRTELRTRGFCDGFFVQDDRKARGYLDPSNEHYAPKLAAAVSAWEAVASDNSLTSGKTPKQAIEKWLREHASEYGLTGSEGLPVNAAIEQIAKVTNWKPEGGAAKTPTHAQVNDNLSPQENSEEKQTLNDQEVDSIPF